MPRLTVKVPKYRLHKATGQAVVTLAGCDIYLGKHGSAQSKAEYNRLIGEWQINGRCGPPPSTTPEHVVSIDEVILAYVEHAKRYYLKNGKPTSSQEEVIRSLVPLHQEYGGLPVGEFRPLTLKALRQKLIDRGTWCRSTINKAIGVIKRMFKWAAENELIPAEVHHRIQAVSGLRQGRSEARESDPVVPAPEEQVEAVLAHVAKPVAAMIQIQRFTGMRPNEVVIMRLCDIDRSGKVWTYTPSTHKTEHHGRTRRIFIGPKAQRVLMPYLQADPQLFLFSPKAADAEHREKKRCNRRTRLSCGNRAGTNRKRSPQRKPGERYTVNTYRGAIHKACLKAFPPPENLARLRVPATKGTRWETDAEWRQRLGQHGCRELTKWRKDHQWSPNQLRHNAATSLRKQFGIEAARVVLGHTSAVVTEIYAEMDFDKAEQIMAEAG